MSRQRMRRFLSLRPVAERRFARTRDYFARLNEIGGPRVHVPLNWIARFAPVRGGVEAIRAAGVVVLGDRVEVPRIWWRAVTTCTGHRRPEKRTPPGNRNPKAS